jgi:hypothetical protein
MRDDSRTGGTKSSAPNGRSSRSGAVIPQESHSETEEPRKRTDESLRLVHHHPGYLRIRASAFLRPQAHSPIVKSARAAAEAVPGFRSWSLNPTTGSVVIQYEPGTLEADDLLKHIAKRAGFRGVEISTRSKRDRRELVSAFLDGVQDVNRAVGELTSERADLRELVPLALVAVSVLSFVVNDERGRLPHWFSALYRSYRIFYQWHRREVRTRERVARQAEERGSADEHSGNPA